MEHLPRYWPFVLVNSPVTGEFPSQRAVTQSFAVFFDVQTAEYRIDTPVIWDAVIMTLL